MDDSNSVRSMEHDAEPLRRGPPVPDYIIIVLSDKNIPVNKIVVHLDTMTVLAKFKTLLTVSLPPDARKVYDDLRAADVPVSDAACRSCPDPCDQGGSLDFRFSALIAEIQITTISQEGYLLTWNQTC